LTVIVTVVVCDKAPEVPLTVNGYVPFAVFVGPLGPEHAPKVTQMTMADTVAKRVRRRCVDRSRKRSISARKSGTTRKKFNGGDGLDIGSGTSIACAVKVSAEVVGGVIDVGLSTQLEFAGAPVHVSATADAKPFVGITDIVTAVPTAP
jgi:hypothetical protein